MTILNKLPPELIIKIYYQLAFENYMTDLSNFVWSNKRLYEIFWNYLKTRAPTVEKKTEQEISYMPYSELNEYYVNYNNQPSQFYKTRFNKTYQSIRRLILNEEDYYILSYRIVSPIVNEWDYKIREINEKKNKIYNRRRD